MTAVGERFDARIALARVGHGAAVKLTYALRARQRYVPNMNIRESVLTHFALSRIANGHPDLVVYYRPFAVDSLCCAQWSVARARFSVVSRPRGRQRAQS